MKGNRGKKRGVFKRKGKCREENQIYLRAKRERKREKS